MSVSDLPPIESLYTVESFVNFAERFATGNPTDFVPTYRADTYPAIDPSAANLNGISIFITGATRGFGRATALSYARAGASVIALGARSSFGAIEHDIHEAAASAGKPKPTVVTYRLDITEQQSVETTAKDFSSRFGSLDILINNAGYIGPWDYTHKTDPGDWWKTWEVNVKGSWLIARSFIPLLIGSRLKTMVSMSSIGATMIAPGGTGYNITKVVGARHAEIWALEYEGLGLLSFSVHPGMTVTDLSSGTPGEATSIMHDTLALGADTLVFLTKERREWLNRRFIMANWDMTEFMAKEEEVTRRDLFVFRLAK